MNQQITWIKNDGKVRPKPLTHYVIKTNWRKVVAYHESDKDGFTHWVSTEGNLFSDNAVIEFAQI